MSRTLSDVAVTEFDSEVKHSYQGYGVLKDFVRTRNNVVGDTYKFRVMGKGRGHERTGSSSMVVPMGVNHSLVTCTLKDFEHPEYTDIFNQKEVNFEEKIELGETIGAAMGRTRDQEIIDAIKAGTFNTTRTADQGFEIEHASAGFNMAKLRELRGYAENLEMRGKQVILIDGYGLESLLANTEVGSADYNTVQALVAGKMTPFMGFHFVTVGAFREEGGINGTTGGVAYMFDSNAVGCAVGMESKTSVDWVPIYSSWLCNGMLKLGACIIDAEGTAKINFQ